MYIVIAGAGMIGTALAEHLSAAKHDVVVIDLDKERSELVYSELGVMSVNGSATNIRVLEDAGIQRADVAVGLMTHDADNLSFVLLARQFNVEQRIVRMRDPRYLEAFELAGATFILRMAQLMMHELLPAIESPRARRIAELGGGEAEMIAVQIPDTAPVVDQTITEVVSSPGFPRNCAFAAIFDKERKLTIPRGDAVIRGGNEVIVVAGAEDVRRVIEALTG